MGRLTGFTPRLRGRRVGRQVARRCRARARQGPVSCLALHDVFRSLMAGGAKRPKTHSSSRRGVLASRVYSPERDAIIGFRLGRLVMLGSRGGYEAIAG